MVGRTWCFTHSGPMERTPDGKYACPSCAKIEAEHPFAGRCFDCKRELVVEGEAGENCGCGDTVRVKGFYQYP